LAGVLDGESEQSRPTSAANQLYEVVEGELRITSRNARAVEKGV
jgi:hypothetical protein